MAMTIEKRMAKFALTNAAEMAEKFGLKREDDITKITVGQSAVVVTGNKIAFGNITAKYGFYSLSGVTISGTSYTREGDLAHVEEQTVNHLPKGAVLYVGEAVVTPTDEDTII